MSRHYHLSQDIDHHWMPRSFGPLDIGGLNKLYTRTYPRYPQCRGPEVELDQYPDNRSFSCFGLFLGLFSMDGRPFQLPIFDGMPIPLVLKVLATLIISYAFFPMVEAPLLKDITYMGDNALWVLTIFNVVIGLILGFFVKSMMNIFISSGTIMTQQIGFAAASYFDPMALREIGPLERIIQWTMIVIILSSGALFPMFKGIVGTFTSIHIYDLGNSLQPRSIFWSFLSRSFFLLCFWPRLSSLPIS